jgi:glyoxylase-like metal-dependent hydrolase (beta-lactamase superfamily II)
MASGPVEFLENLYFVERGYLNANHFIYAGTEPELIDTGYIRDLDQTLLALHRCGVDPGDVRRIVTTHCHCDHIGGHRHIQAQSGCDIVLHPAGKHFIDQRDDWSTWWRYYDQEAAFFDATGTIDDGDLVAIGPHEFLVLHTPGHAADMVVMYHRAEKLLLSSDALWESDMGVITQRVEGSAAVLNALASVKRLAELDVRCVYPGHGAAFDDFSGAVERTLGRLQHYLESPGRVGQDVLKKIMVYTLLMQGTISVREFFDRLMTTHWFPETVSMYFDGRFQEKYDEVLGLLMASGAIHCDRDALSTSVNP